MEQVEEFTFTTGADISEYLLFSVNLFNTLQYRQHFEAVFEHLIFSSDLIKNLIQNGQAILLRKELNTLLQIQRCKGDRKPYNLMAE